MNGVHVIVALVGIAIAVAFLGLYLWSIVWAYGDANARGKSGCLVALLVMFLSWPLGLIIWRIFRPEGDRHEWPDSSSI